MPFFFLLFAALLLLFFPLFLLALFLFFFLLLEALLLDPRQHGAGQGKVVLGILVVRVLRQHLFVSLGRPGEIAELKARVSQVVGGVLLDLGALGAAEGLGRFLVALRTVEGDAAAVAVAEALDGLRVVAGLEALVGLLLLVQEPSGMGSSGEGH